MQKLLDRQPGPDQNTLFSEFKEIIGQIDLGFDIEDENIWEKIAGYTNDIATPPNALDAGAMALALYGLNVAKLDSWKGITTTGMSFVADLFDGWLARKTKTSSPLGEAVDAGGDKIKLLAALYQIYKLDLAPRSLIWSIFAQNGYNAGLTILDIKTNDIPAIHPSWLGKRAILAQQTGLGLNVVGSEVKKTDDKKGNMLKLAGSVIGFTGVIMGVGSSAGYTAKYYDSRKLTK